MYTSNYWIEKLKLQKHPEGGYFKEVYKAKEMIKKEHLPKRYSGDRFHSTSIYFLITPDNFSAFHRIKSDETWHFYYGSSLSLHIISKKGEYLSIKLGNNPENGEVFQYTVEKGDWFAASVDEKDSYSLLGCTVSPGFDYDDFEMGKKDELTENFPQFKKLINRFARI
ncbi:MAG: cupin domain-containing protein [Ignavibacteriae bacterium]|nr:MAG: cupin domain-containing protein [Ignavibacteriota bacterium]